MKLYDVPAGSRIRLLNTSDGPPGANTNEKGDVLKFFNIDGMYSYCQDLHGNVVHVKAWEEVEIV